tara:strand:+ start:134 stop:757 length:624 start_codon:yes stop_codon:yes gene_type:complete
MQKINIENLKTLNKNAILVDTKNQEIKTETGGIMDNYLKHFQEVMAIKGITNFKSAVIYSADLLAYWDTETKRFVKCSRNPVSSEKGQGILFNKNADDRTVEPDSRRKVRNKMSKAIDLGIDVSDTNKIDSWKSLNESIKHAEEIKQSQEDKKIEEETKDILTIIKNTPDSKKPALLSKLQAFKINLQTTEVKGKRVIKPATGKKVA